MSTTINTFHSSFNPPPVPPRSGHRGGPALPSNTPLVKFLSVLLLLLMIQTFGGFLYLFHRINTLQDRRYDNEISTLKQLQQCAENPESEDLQYCSKLVQSYKTVMKKISQVEGQVALFTETGSFTVPQARMVLLSQDKMTDQTTNLMWDSVNSVKDKISLKSSVALTIHYPGYYLIQSQVTFSKPHQKGLLKQTIWTRKANTENPVQLLVSICSLPRNNSIPDMCTSSQTGVFRLEKGQMVFVNVTDRSLVNPDFTTFGLFRLQD